MVPVPVLEELAAEGGCAAWARKTVLLPGWEVMLAVEEVDGMEMEMETGREGWVEVEVWEKVMKGLEGVERSAGAVGLSGVVVKIRSQPWSAVLLLRCPILLFW